VTLIFFGTDLGDINELEKKIYIIIVLIDLIIFLKKIKLFFEQGKKIENK
jgi:hypothetical protein